MIIKLGGHEVAYAYGYLANAYGLSSNEPLDRRLGTERIHVAEALDQIEQACSQGRLNLPVTLDYVPVVRRKLQDAKTYGDIQCEVGQLRERMHSELKTLLFLFVPPIESGYYNVKEAFGPEVARKFPQAVSDIESAGDGIALGMYTAAVFHLMRVMERGVQRLGKRLGVKLTDEKNWQNILDEINKRIKVLPENTKKLKTRKAVYAAASDHLFNVKLAWRNPVMHPKASYNSEEAADVYKNVKSFMAHLAPLV